MKLNSLPKELFVEVLDYIADYEPLGGLVHLLEGEYTLLDVRRAFRELSLLLRKETEEERTKKVPDYKGDQRLSPQAKAVLSVLSPGDERKLLSRFGLLEEN